jgi:hypothetical protein
MMQRSNEPAENDCDRTERPTKAGGAGAELRCASGNAQDLRVLLIPTSTVEKGMEAFTQNFYDENAALVEIKLDPRFPFQNARSNTTNTESGYR